MSEAIKQAVNYLIKHGVEISPAMKADIEALSYPPKPAIKSASEFKSINKEYHDAITRSLLSYFEGSGVAEPRKEFKSAALLAMTDVFDLGWTDGGQELPIDEESMTWIEARINQEFGFIDMLFEQIKALRKEADFDYFTWITARADGYVNTLREVYNAGKLRAMDDIMVTFEGDDGAESCEDCQRLKGKKHKLSWFIARDYVPPFGVGLECHVGKRCQHGLMDMKGKWVTV